MAVSHKNKTLTTFLALTLGGIGAHRFYLHGWRDLWGWMHFSALPVSIASLAIAEGQPWLFAASPLVISVLSAFIETLVIGLMSDEEWDGRHNAGSGRQSRSGWPLAVLLVLTVGLGAIALFFVLARTVDLLYTGGSFG